MGNKSKLTRAKPGKWEQAKNHEDATLLSAYENPPTRKKGPIAPLFPARTIKAQPNPKTGLSRRRRLALRYAARRQQLVEAAHGEGP